MQAFSFVIYKAKTNKLRWSLPLALITFVLIFFTSSITTTVTVASAYGVLAALLAVIISEWAQDYTI